MDENILNRNRNINRGYRKLEVWQESVELFRLISKKLDSLENLNLKIRGQLEGSALSCSSNIAEGYGRRSLKENINFINIALASLCENYTQVYSLSSAGKIDQAWFDEYDNALYSLENKLINFNKSMIAKLDKNDWKNDYILRDIFGKYEP